MAGAWLGFPDPVEPVIYRAKNEDEDVAQIFVEKREKDILTLEALRGGGQINSPRFFWLFKNFYSLTECQKLWHNCSLFVNKSFDTF